MKKVMLVAIVLALLAGCADECAEGIAHVQRVGAGVRNAGQAS
jgi:uncharacterized protein YcfL